MHVYRTHNCAQLNEAEVGQKVRLSGWIHRKRDHGGVLFIDLRDHYGVKLVGEKSFGKGTVQELFALKDDSKLKITVANWLLPKGQTIEENGLTPDFEVKLTEEDIENKKDPQLEKALEILKEKIKNQ